MILKIPSCQEKRACLLEANKLSGVVAHNLSGLKVIVEVTDETDRIDAGDSEDAICRGVWGVDGEPFDTGRGSKVVGSMFQDVSALH
jgi:hypothetical protein